MSQSVNEVAVNSYNINAELYNNVRPSYPTEAVNQILSYACIPMTAADVDDAVSKNKTYNILDLAAGSGLFTSVVHNQVASTCNKSTKLVEICAVEPSKGMRSVFSQMLPHIDVYDGTSTSIPFPDGHFDVVTVAQAFHWFSNGQSLAEINRVLKKGGNGTLALIWNLESAEIEWVKQLRALYEPYDAAVPQYRKGEWEQVFYEGNAASIFELPIMKKRFKTEMLVTQSQMIDRVESKSYITALPQDELNSLKSKLRQLLYHDYRKEFHHESKADKAGEMRALHILDVELAMIKTT